MSEFCFAHIKDTKYACETPALSKHTATAPHSQRLFAILREILKILNINDNKLARSVAKM